MTALQRRLYLVTNVVLCMCAVTCASTESMKVKPTDVPSADSDLNSAKIIYQPGAEETQAPTARERESTGSPMESRLTLRVESSTLGDVVREVGETNGGNLVLMSGLERRRTNQLSWRRATLSKVATDIAAQGGLAVQELSSYYFLFAPGYEPLVEVSLAGRLDPAYATKRIDVAFGSGIKLFTVLAWMGYALDLSIVADNSVAESRCGEMALQQVPLESALEAVLKSARVVAYDVESTDEFIFFRNPDNRNPTSVLLNPEPPDDNQTQTMNRRVQVVLPHAPTPNRPLEMQTTAVPLTAILDSLSQQLGILVVAEQGLEDLPVNPVVLNNVRVQTAMDLLIRQWLVPDFGYQITSDRIVIRRR